SQDYLNDMTITSFGQNYLGVSWYSWSSVTPPLHGEPGNPVGGSFGTFGISYPPDFTANSDRMLARVGAEVAFRDAGDMPVCIDIDQGYWRTVFMSVSWGAIYYNDASTGAGIMQSILTFLCEEWVPTPTITPTATPTNTPTSTVTPEPTITPVPIPATDAIGLSILVFGLSCLLIFNIVTQVRNRKKT
ncbi:hypothetical protein JW979_02855, partial [bacterium]|nr:hypothetical protein [candidate division CSSED10-310 bacterium]